MIVNQEIEYRVGDMSFRAYVAFDEQLKDPRPCVMIAHDWAGRAEAPCEKAKQLAGMGFVGVAIDMFGDATIGHDNEERKALITPLMENREALAKRMLAAFNAVRDLPQVDVKKIAAIGYCFGGLCVLDLARTGAALRGVISFHGLLMEPTGTPTGPIQAKILVLHGFDDPLVPPEQVLQFTKEMTQKNADWQVHMYGHTAHSFTNPQANDHVLGLHYNQTADHRSWISATAFFEEIFGR